MYPKASENIEAIIGMIGDIIDNKSAYVADGDVYFSVETADDYGKLSGQKIHEMKVGARIAPGERKRNPLDFALWKAAKPGEPAWPSPWGDGRPGWHIECSAMSSAFLGTPFDIHGGGQDLIFPHHENEISQAEAATHRPFARYWLHSGMLKVNGEKMSKSLGNIITVKEALCQWDAEVLRFFFASYHYRSPADFTPASVEQARRGLDRIVRTRDDLRKAAGNAKPVVDPNNHTPADQAFFQAIQHLNEQFAKAMDDDFNTPEAISALFIFTKEANRYLADTPSSALCARALGTLVSLGNVLTILQHEKSVNFDPLCELVQRYGGCGEGDLNSVMNELLSIRQQAREQKQWPIADDIREALLALNIEIQDTAEGTKWRRV
jgi:cysteinyl-tRNA synthetase